MRLPHYSNSKEYESNLSEFRVQAGLTIKDLCNMARISIAAYSGLNSGTLSPINMKNGEISPIAQALADVLNADLADLFPRYFCSINHTEELSDDQIIDSFHPSLVDAEYHDPELILLRKERCDLLHKFLSKLRPKEAIVFKMRVMDELSLGDVANHFECSKARVSDLERSATRRLKYHIIQSKEFLYLFA